MMGLNKKQIFVLITFIILSVLIVSQVSATYTKSSSRYTSFKYGYSTGFFNQGGTQVERQYCDSGQDFVLQIGVFGCSPAVVRSDLLEEQDAQVYCQIVATKINPLVGVDAINSVQLSGEYSSDVRDIGFHAQRVALGKSGSSVDITTPLMNNLGYAVINLAQKKNASAMPDFVEGNITATLTYDLKNAFGIGKANFYLPLMNDRQWLNQKDQYGFWNARAFLRATDISSDKARISVQTDSREIASLYLEKGETSNKIYLPGFDCLAGLNLKLDDLVVPDRRARLNINGEIMQVGPREEFLDGKCKAREVVKQGVVEKVNIYCQEDDKRSTFDLVISPKVNLSIDGVSGQYQTGDKLYNGGEKTVYLGYVGTKDGSYNQEDLFIYTFAMQVDQEKLNGEDLKDISNLVDSYEAQKITGNELVSFVANFGKTIIGSGTNFYKWMFDGNSYNKIGFAEEDDVESKKVKVLGFMDAYDKTLDSRILELYEKASADYNTIISGLSSAKYPDTSKLTKGEQAFVELIKLSYKTGQKRTAAEICAQLKGDYPQSSVLATLKTECNNPILFSNPEKVTQHVTINNEIKEISFQGISDPKFDDYGVEVVVTGPNGERKTAKLRYGQQFYLEGMRAETEQTTSEKDTIRIRSPPSISFAAVNPLFVTHPGFFYFTYGSSSLSEVGAWKWSADKTNWMDVSEKRVVGGKWDSLDLAGDFSDLADLLGNSNFSMGVKTLFEYQKKMDEDYFDTENKNSCEECGENVFGRDTFLGGTSTELNFDFCTLKECTAIGEKVGKSCQYTESNVNYARLLVPVYGWLTIRGGQCTTPGGTPSTVTKKPYGEYIMINKLDEEWADITAHLIKPESWRDKIGDFLFGSTNTKINLGQTIDVGQGFKVSVTKINLNRVAKVSIDAGIARDETKATFPFKIGIEQRGIQLTPDEARKKIQQLNDTVAEFEEKSERLGQIVKGLKTACIGTSAALMIKNFLENKDGKAIARKDVMRGKNGWYERCTLMVSNKEYKSIDDCLYKNSAAINEEVKNWYGFQNEVNKDIKLIQSDCDKTNFLGENVVNDSCFVEGYVTLDYRNRMKSCLSRLDADGNGLVEIQDDAINITKFVDGLRTDRVSIEDFRQMDLYCRVQGSVNLNSMSESRLTMTMKDIYENTNSENRVNELASKLGLKSGDAIFIVDKESKPYPYTGKVYSDIKSKVILAGVDDNTPIQTFQLSGGKQYIAVLLQSEKKFGVKKFYNIDGSAPDFSNGNDRPDVYFVQYDKDTYNNKYIGSSSGTTYPVIKYFENEPNKGLPAIVPFDVEKGWYAAIKNTLPAFGAIGSYDESGKVRSFSICNVGPNGIEDNQGPDDICELINTGTRMPYNQFNGLTELQASALVDDAYKAIEKASREHGKNTINIGGKDITVGAPAVDIPDIQCYDFMSVQDCRILFNVCDPVICPSSRCDLNGAYPVQDVVQSGIIGSLVLCLPNYPQVYVPICLTGVKAGLDGWLSVHKSYMQCLQQGIDTGETVGICDEIYSLYKCEFFWRQAAPFAKIAVPKALEIIFGQNTRGGGEYLGVKTALDNTESSVNYFTQYYADNTFKAFQARATENVGGEVCKAYVSGVIPTSGSALDLLTEPDSPTQFHGRFDEIPYTTVTNPPQSQYKIFYHIYAGNDRGAYYKVYLKGESDPYYQDARFTRNIASGYIAKGGFKTDTPDFTGPSGYKTLCIMVNDQEECGFKEVSTSFEINYLSDQYVKNEAQRRDITSEKDCVAGSQNLYSLINPNIQEGASNALNPAIYNQGLIRICATKDPGQGTDVKAGGQDARWVPVGTCNANMKCWLDTNSVKESIKNLNIQGEVLKNQEDAVAKALADGPEYIKDFPGEMSKIKAEKNSLKRIDLLTDIIINNKVFWNSEKAEVYFQRGNEYASLAMGKYNGLYGNDTQSTPNETDEIDKTYSSPVFQLDEGVAQKTDLYYAFSKGIWSWSIDKQKWAEASKSSVTMNNPATGKDYEYALTDENKAFISKYFKGKAYFTGFKALMDRVAKDDEAGWFLDFFGGDPELKTDMVLFDKDELFFVMIGEDRFYLRNKIPEIPLAPFWEFSLDKNEWKSYPLSSGDKSENLLLLGSYFKDERSIDLIHNLLATDFYAGARIIFDVNERVSIGGVYLAENKDTGFKVCLEPGKVNLKEYEDYLKSGPLAPDACRVAVEGVLNDNCATINECSDYGYRPSCQDNVCRLDKECMWQTDECVENTNSFSSVSPEFYIKDGGVWGTGFFADNAFYLVYNFKYANDKGKWVASYDNTHTPSTDDKNFIKSLEGLNYVGGLPLLLDKIFVDGDQLITDKVTFEDGVYTVDFSDELSLKYENGWRWSLDGDEWFAITNVDAGQPTLTDSRSTSLIQSLKNQNAYVGAKMIFNLNLDLPLPTRDVAIQKTDVILVEDSSGRLLCLKQSEFDEDAYQDYLVRGPLAPDACAVVIAKEMPAGEYGLITFSGFPDDVDYSFINGEWKWRVRVKDKSWKTLTGSGFGLSEEGLFPIGHREVFLAIEPLKNDYEAGLGALANKADEKDEDLLSNGKVFLTGPSGEPAFTFSGFPDDVDYSFIDGEWKWRVRVKDKSWKTLTGSGFGLSEEGLFPLGHREVFLVIEPLKNDYEAGLGALANKAEEDGEDLTSNGRMFLIENKQTGEPTCVLPEDYFNQNMAADFNVKHGTAPSICEEIVVSGGTFRMRTFEEVREILDEASSKKIISASCAQYSDLVVDAANTYGINDPLLLLALTYKESTCNADAVSPDESSYGLIQINTIFKRRDNELRIGHCGDFGLFSDRTVCIEQLKDPSFNINVGAQILKSYYRDTPKSYVCGEFNSYNQKEPIRNVEYSGWKRALRNYNGWGCAGYRSDGSEIWADQDYVEKVMEKYNQLAALA